MALEIQGLLGIIMDKLKIYEDRCSHSLLREHQNHNWLLDNH